MEKENGMLYVIKIGGGMGSDAAAMASDIEGIIARGDRVAVVHGCSHATDQLAEALGAPMRYVTSTAGVRSRYTDAPTLEIFSMAARRVNGAIVHQMQRLGLNALGLTGLDGALLRGPRKQMLRIIEPDGRQRIIRDDYTGRVERVNADLLRLLLAHGYIPVIAPLALSDSGDAVNVDGDRAAAGVAAVLGADALIILTNVPGLLADVADESSLVTSLERAHIDEFARNIAGGMRRKLMGAREALQAGVPRVVLADGRVAQSAAIRAGGARHGDRMTADLTQSSLQAQAQETHYEAGAYSKRPIRLVSGQGAEVVDDEGRHYIDCVGGIGVANVGHANARVVAAITAQASRLISCPEMFFNDTRGAYLEQLVNALPAGLDRVFLCNSGTEAVEAAIKVARLATGRTEVVATMRAFHGRTLGALSATWEKHYREPFMPLVPGFRHIRYNDLTALETAITSTTAAVLLEVIQGEGGVHLADPDYLQGAAELCRQRGAMLIFDEIQTAFGRTGRLWACEHSGVTPDILCLAKGIAGGIPMGATCLGPRVASFPTGLHGSTFGGNPLACAAASATLGELRERQLPEHAAQMGARLLAQIEASAATSTVIRAVRGLGLMVGVELRERVQPYLEALVERGVLALNAGPGVIRLLPPLVIDAAQIDRVATTLAEVLS